MTIQTINIGTSPNDDTGDDPRTAGQKLNSNFTTSSHAASRNVGTGSGNIPDADGLNMVGATENYTSNNLNLNVFGGASGRLITGDISFSSATTLVAYLRTMAPVGSNPSSITLGAGTYTLRKPNGTVLRPAVPNTDILLASDSSGQATRLIIKNSTGLVNTDDFELLANASNSTLEVNF